MVENDILYFPTFFSEVFIVNCESWGYLLRIGWTFLASVETQMTKG